jgi:L-fuconolactonase
MASIRKNFLPEALLPILKNKSIGGSIAVQADESDEETALLLSLSDQHDFVKGVVGWADLKSPFGIEELENKVSHKKLLGFRCIMQGQPDEVYLKNDIFIRNIASLARLDFSYDILIYHHQFPSLISFVEQLPNNRLMLDHIGKPAIKEKKYTAWKENIRIVAQHPGIYCKLSGMITEADYTTWRYKELIPYLDTVAEYFGVDRLCFGSDWPVCLVAGSYDKMMEVVVRWSKQFNKEEQEKIFGENACRFYKL